MAVACDRDKTISFHNVIYYYYRIYARLVMDASTLSAEACPLYKMLYIKGKLSSKVCRRLADALLSRCLPTYTYIRIYIKPSAHSLSGAVSVLSSSSICRKAVAADLYFGVSDLLNGLYII